MMNDMPETYIAYRMDIKSRQKIIRELMGKGIDRKTAINAWEEEAALNMPDEKEILYRTIEKKYPPDTELDEKKNASALWLSCEKRIWIFRHCRYS